ncbi:MAG TPA: hypothetical protein VF482_18205 [Trebonia sp.]
MSVPATHVLTVGQAGQWWPWLSEQRETGGFLGGVTIFAVTATRPC